MGDGRETATMRLLPPGAACLGAVLALLSLSSPALGSDATSFSRPGRWSAGFALERFQGRLDGDLSLRRQLTQRAAMKLALQVNLAGDQSDADHRQSGETYSIRELEERTGDHGGFVLTPSLVLYPSISGHAALVVSGGPFLAFHDNNSESSRESIRGSEIVFLTLRSEEDNWEGGLAVTAGAEWRFTRRLSLDSHYGIKAGLTHQTRRTVERDTVQPATRPEQIDSRSRTDRTNGFSLDMGQLALGLSFYF